MNRQNPAEPRRVWFATLIVLILAAAQAVAGQSPDRDSILSGIEQRYAGKEFSAEFSQRSTLKAIDITEEASGRAYFSHPGKMRWEYLKPEKHQIITDGETLWIYKPEDNQVVIGNARTFFQQGAGGAFLSDIALIRKQFEINIDAVTQDDADLILIPATPSPDIESIRLRVSLSTHEINTITTSNAYGDTTEIGFSAITFKEIEPGIFSFTIPDGADILHMNQ